MLLSKPSPSKLSQATLSPSPFHIPMLKSVINTSFFREQSELTERIGTTSAVEGSRTSLSPSPKEPSLLTNPHAGTSMTERRKTRGRRGASVTGGGPDLDHTPAPTPTLILSFQTTIKKAQRAATTMDLPKTITMMIVSHSLLSPTLQELEPATMPPSPMNKICVNLSPMS